MEQMAKGGLSPSLTGECPMTTSKTKNFLVAGLCAAALAGTVTVATPTPADAQTTLHRGAVVRGAPAVRVAPRYAYPAYRHRGYNRGYSRGGAVAAGVVGGLALGALAAGAARPAYAAPVYGAPAYGGDCYVVNRRYRDAWGRPFIQQETVCE
jgi:hypothetical protein